VSSNFEENISRENEWLDEKSRCRDSCATLDKIWAKKRICTACYLLK
jgi:hypothetical protein